MLGSRLAIWAVIGIALAQCQPPAQFEVASIKEIVDGTRVMGQFNASGNRAEYRGFGINMLTAEAWNVRGDEIALAPGVDPKIVSAHVYDIAAVATEGTLPSRGEFRLMLHSLLATRFKLATHTERREKQVYVLVTDGKPQLKPNSSDARCRVNASRTPEGQKGVATHCPMQALMNALFVDRPIYDETGLTGFYDFEITSALPFQSGDPQAITPFSAVKESGLKLESKQRLIDTIVIDHVEAPEEN